MKPSTSFRSEVEKILEGRVIPKSGINLDTGEPIIDEIVKLHEDELEKVIEGTPRNLTESALYKALEKEWGPPRKLK